jgi:hypothetical protein
MQEKLRIVERERGRKRKRGIKEPGRKETKSGMGRSGMLGKGC